MIRGAASALLLAGILAAPGRADEAIIRNGPPEERLNLVFLGDGYTASQLDLYRDDVRRFAEHLFSQPPFSDHAALFNVYRVDVASPQSGVDDACAGVSVDTALDVGYRSTGPDCRLLFTTSAEKVFQAAERAPGYQPEAGLVVVIANTPVYGGAATAGNYCVVYRGPDGPEAMAHELGHSFALLADEYPLAGAVYAGAEPVQPNVTIETDRARVKWGRWIDRATPLPTVDALPDRPGLYEGAFIFQSGVYRPTYDSKMRTLYRGYDRVDVGLFLERMDALLPPTVSLTAPASGTHVSGTVQVTARAADGVGLSRMELLVDGRPFAFPLPVEGAEADERWALDSGSLTEGVHSITVRATDTAGNRTDRTEAITVSAPGVKDPGLDAEKPVLLSAGLRDGVNDAVSFGEDAAQVTISDGEGRKVYAAPGNAAWDGGEAASGVYVARIRRRDGSEAYKTIILAR